MRAFPILCASTALLTLASCGGQPFDMDFRSLGDGFSTTQAALAAPARPAPDGRGIIAYPTYQVVVAQEGDTVSAIAGRLGFAAEELAAFNGIPADQALRRDEVVALPRPVAAAIAQPAVQPVAAQPNVAPAPLATVATTPLAPTAPVANVPPGVEPVRHRVQPGETAYSVARLYGVPVRTVADWNGLGTDLAVREGQVLLVPPSADGAPVPAALPQPGEGSVTPVPPSAVLPLPQERPAPAAEAQPDPVAAPQDLGETTEAPASRLATPADGPIIRDYAPGRNEGIDIGAPAGSEVRAADAGTVAAITTNTDGIQIVVIRHADDLLTVYTNLDNLTVAKDQAVSRGQVIGRVRTDDPSFLHFEVRRGMASADPTEFLP
jgi:murein DD-endopeptidase MepM/ murein hydrolase activator NlpD